MALSIENRIVKLQALLLTALRSLLMHRLRSVLTVLGLVFGVASVIVMLAIAQGASAEAQRQIESLGVLNVIARSNQPLKKQQDDEDQIQQINEYGLTYEDLRRVKATIPSASLVTAMRSYPQKVRHYRYSLDSPILGIEPNYAMLNHTTIASGRFIEANDIKYARNVCVLGADVARELFRHENAVGKSIQIADLHYFKVIGVAAWQTPSAGIGTSLASQDYNKHVYVPITTDRSRFGEVLFKQESGQFTAEKLELSQITVQCDRIEHVQATADNLKSLLAKFHPREDFVVVTPLDLLEQSRKTQQIFSYVLGSVAAISLLVGGIGIMNIMLATVSERQQEIGIRRALGANRSDIIFQFLVETLVLSCLGAGIGVVLGIGVPAWVSWASEIPTQVTWWSPAVATAVALVTGIAFGIYPARQAAMLDPIEALRRV